MRGWLRSIFDIKKSDEEIENIVDDNEQIDILPSLNELRLLSAIEQLHQIGILKLILNSSTLNRLPEKDTINWDSCIRFLKEIDIIEYLEPEQIKEFYKIISIPDLIPTIHRLYQTSGRKTNNLIEIRNEKAKDEIEKIILRLREYNFNQLIRHANMVHQSAWI